MDLNVLVCGMKEEFATRRVLQHLDKEMIPYKFVEVGSDFFDGPSPACYVMSKGQCKVVYITNGIGEALEHIKNFHKAAKDSPAIYA